MRLVYQGFGLGDPKEARVGDICELENGQKVTVVSFSPPTPDVEFPQFTARIQGQTEDTELWVEEAGLEWID